MVTHFLILSKTVCASYLRVAKMKHGPTLTFKIHKYSLAADIAQSQLRPRCPSDLFKNPPVPQFVSPAVNGKLLHIAGQALFMPKDCITLNYDKETKLIDGTTLSDYNQWMFLAESGNLCKTIKTMYMQGSLGKQSVPRGRGAGELRGLEYASRP
ncbi:hypothetical protein H5410_047748, partial [Solanum commersonii]